MIDEHQTTIQLQVHPSLEKEDLYRLLLMKPDQHRVIGEIQLPEIIHSSPGQLASINPWEFLSHHGEESRAQLEEMLSSDLPVVEIGLPASPIAAANWELIVPQASVLRRPLNSPRFALPTVATPMHWGIVPLLHGRVTTSQGVSDIIQYLRRDALPKMVETYTLDAPDSMKDLLAAIARSGLQGLHILLRTEIDSNGRRVRFGREVIPLKTFIEEIARTNVRFLILHDLNQNRLAGISALRCDSQFLPPESSTAMVLLAEPPRSRAVFRSLDTVYKNVFEDEHLGTSVGQLHTIRPRGGVYVSAVANAGISKALDFETASRGLKNRLEYLKEQATKLEEGLGRADVLRFARGDALERFAELPDLEIIGRVRHRDPAARREERQREQPIKSLERLQGLVKEEELGQKPIVAEIYRHAVDDVSQSRFPAALFYHVMREDVLVPIPKINSISPPPPGVGLEFHFWIDVIEGGIDYVGERPQVVKPKSAPYPVTLVVEVWSEDLNIKERRRTLVLEASGPTQEHARFPIELPAPVEILAEGKRGELFVFISHLGEADQKELVAVFRVEALITREVTEDASAQILEHAYLATDWFRFKGAAVGSAATIFLAKKAGHLQVFTLTNSVTPWGFLGATEQALYQLSEKIYRHLHHLSIKAAQQREQGQELSFEKSANGLANLGYELFTTVFRSPQTSESVGVLVKNFLSNLPPESTVTIALNRDTGGFIIPWGLMYDQVPPFGSAGSLSTFFGQLELPQQEAFWGVRFNLGVRPAISNRNAHMAEAIPLRVGAAWYSHVETEKLKDDLKELVADGSIALEPLRARNMMIPGLSSGEFDLIHFFCHGHTSLPGKDLDQFLLKDYEALAAVSDDPAVKDIFSAIKQEPPKSSFILLDGGVATYPVLTDKLERLKGQPIVLLSMCESAQVTCAGAGFVTLFLDRGARSVIGTEGPTLWSLGREMDTQIIRRLLDGQSIGRAFSETRRALVKKNVLALIYSLFGDVNAKLRDRGHE